MRRRTFLKAGAAAAAVSAMGCLPQDRGPRRPPNVLFLFTDDQRFDTIHALGNEVIQTPHMDRLVRRGVSFTHAHIMGGDNGAICICSRACLLTGRTLWRAPHDLGRDLAIWPEVMKQAGYTTFATGKWHSGTASFARSFTAGDKILFGGMSDHLRVPVHAFDPEGKYPKSGVRVEKTFSSRLFSDAAIRFLREYEDDKPFLAYVAYTSPHDPRMPPKPFADLYKPADIPVPRNFMPEHPFDNGELKVRDERLAPWPRTPEIVQEHIAAYYGMISHTDAEIGRVLAALEETGHADDTVVIFSGDNGLAVGRHGLMGKQNLYDHSVRVPLVVSGPGIRAGRRTDALCYLHDVFPTVCDLAGLPIPATVESRSLAPALAGAAARPYDSVYAAYRDVQRMVRMEEWKLIWYPKIGRFQLFDMAADPDEMKDLSAAPEQAGRLAELKGELAAWQERTGDRIARPA